jgi:hypothetical protein
MMPDELVGRIIHQLHQLRGLLYDGFAITPGKNSRKKSGYFNILFPAELVWNANGVICNK